MLPRTSNGHKGTCRRRHPMAHTKPSGGIRAGKDAVGTDTDDVSSSCTGYQTNKSDSHMSSLRDMALSSQDLSFQRRAARYLGDRPPFVRLGMPCGSPHSTAITWMGRKRGVSKWRLLALL